MTAGSTSLGLGALSPIRSIAMIKYIRPSSVVVNVAETLKVWRATLQDARGRVVGFYGKFIVPMYIQPDYYRSSG